MSSLKPDPIHFYYPGQRPLKADSKSGLDCWVIKTFDYLVQSGKEDQLKLVSEVPESGITVFHKGFFPKGLCPSRHQYFVCIQADYGRYRHAQYHIHQNPAGPGNFRFSPRSVLEDVLFLFVKNAFIPHWNQDDIIPRLADRGDKFENVVFMGLTKNFPSELMKQGFKDKLSALGLKLQVQTDDSRWNDYSEADCVLAIRDFQQLPHYNKPSSKIINALIAGVPVIAGNESSALFLKKNPGIPLEIVSDETSLLSSLNRLKTNYKSALKSAADSNMQLRSYHDASIAEQWLALLNDIRKRYQIWRAAGTVYRKAFYQFSKI